MNQTKEMSCKCKPCAGSSCTCGCQKSTALNNCACGPQCNCGDACNCAKK